AGLPPRLRSMQEPAVRRISGARTPRVESLAGEWLRQDYEVHRHSAAEPGMPEPPILAKAEAAPKVGPPVVLANAKATVGAIPAQVFEALTNAAQLGAWWAEDVRVDAQMSGVYEGTLPSGRVEGPITWTNVHTIRAPEHPSGWPSAIAPPFTFVITWRKPSSRMTVRAWMAKASFSSIRSRSCTVRPARDSTFRVAGMGPTPIVLGSTPAAAEDTTRTRGVSPSSSALRSLVKSTTAAPSLIPLELPAVTVPPSRNTGRSFESASREVSARGGSSRETKRDPP